MKIAIKQDPKSEELFKKVSALVRPGWGYLNLSDDAKEVITLDKSYF
jgi:hypothetical protein